MTRRRSRTERDIPLYLLPLAVARRVRAWGGAVYRISIVRTHRHHYNVTVRTKQAKRGLAPPAAAFEAVPGASGAKAGGRKRRGCTA